MSLVRVFFQGLAALFLTVVSSTVCLAEDAPKTADAPLPEIAMGDPKAPVTLIEYSSLSCPHCAAFHRDVLPKLKENFIDTGKVRYIVREYPLNEAALGAAVTARCLDPSQYLAFMDLLFSRQKDWAAQEDAITPLRNFAKQAGLPEDKFDKCIEDETLQKKIMASRAEGTKLGVNATPTLILNGTILSNISYDAIAEAINKQLSK